MGKEKREDLSAFRRLAWVTWGAGGLALVALGVAWGSSGCIGSQTSRSQGRDAAASRPTGDAALSLRNAHYYKLMGRSDLAIKELEEAYHHDPANLKVLDRLAQHHEELGDWKRAQQLYQEALKRSGDHPSLRNNLGFSYYQSGNLSQAETCFRQVLKRWPQNPSARNNLGLLLCRQGRWEEAQALWRQAEGEPGAQEKMRQVAQVLGKEPPAHLALQSSPPVATAESPKKPQTATVVPQSPAGPPLAPQQVAAARVLPPQLQVPVTQPTVSVTPSPSSMAAATREPAVPQTPSAAEASPTASPVEPPKKEVQEPPVQASPRPQQKPETARLTKTSPEPAKPAASTRISTPSASASGESGQQGKKPAEKVAQPTPTPTGGVKTVVAPQPSPKGSRTFLTAQELMETEIEVRNGNGSTDLARVSRSLLSQDGFSVAAIGNHIDFGQEVTAIYYRPEVERVAQAIKDKYFPTATLQSKPDLTRADVRVVLGRELPIDQILARLNEMEDKSEKLAGRSEESSPSPRSLLSRISEKEQGREELSFPRNPSPSSAPSPASQAPAEVRQIILTAQELSNTTIEVRNGNGATEIARETRSLLSEEGFSVAAIGNHIDFGQEVTAIYYRPEAERVARALKSKYFPTSTLQLKPDLTRVDVRVILGQELLVSGSLAYLDK